MKKLMIKIQTLVLFMTGVLLINSCTTNTNSPVEERDEIEPIIIHDTIIDSRCAKELDSIKYVYELTKYYRKEQKSDKEKFFSLLKEPIENLTYTELMFCYTYKEAPYSTKLLLKQELNKKIEEI